MSVKNLIYHILPIADLHDFRISGCYRPTSVGQVGFIHACEAKQVRGVWARYYQDQIDQSRLAIITIDPQHLNGDLRYEDTTGSGEKFPHIYGELSWQAVCASGLLPDWLALAAAEAKEPRQ